MPLTMSQVSLGAGEVSNEVGSRVDIEFWQSAVKKALNFTVDYHGGLKNRPGCVLIDQAASNGNIILQEFKFSNEQTYMLEFTAGKIRIIYRGGYLLDDSDQIIEVTTEYTDDELEELTFTQKADVLSVFSANHPVTQLLRYSNTDWRFEQYEPNQGPFESLNTNDGNTIWVSSSSGSVTIYADFDAFDEEQIGTQLKLEQQSSGETVSWVQRMSVSKGDNCYYAGNYYQAVIANSNSAGKALTGDTPPEHTSGSYWDGGNQVMSNSGYDNVIGVLWKYLHSGYGVIEITGVTNARQATGTVITTIPSGIVGGDISSTSQTFQNKTTETQFSLQSSFSSQILEDYSVSLEAYNGNGAESKNLSSYNNEFSINFDTMTLTLSESPHYLKEATEEGEEDEYLPRNVVVTQASSIRSTYYWAFSTWLKSQGYPKCGGYYQQRFCTAGTSNLPQTLWMSYTDSYDNYTIDNPTIAENSLRFDIDSQQVNQILHMASLNAFLLFTSGSVWGINTQGTTSALDATDPPNVDVQTYHGACSIPPKLTGSRVLYVQDGQKIIRDLAYDYQRIAYDGDDLTVRASHLFKDTKIISWCYAKNPHNQFWVAFESGNFAVLTYMKEQNVIGWASGSVDGDVVAFGSVREDGYDRVYAVVRRNGTNYITRFAKRDFSDIRDQCFLDLALNLDGTASETITATGDSWDYEDEVTFTASGDYFTSDLVDKPFGIWSGSQTYLVTMSEYISATEAKMTIEQALPDELVTSLKSGGFSDWGRAYHEFGGIDHLEGQEVVIFGDGAVQGREVVSNGSVSIHESLSCVKISVGLEYDQIIKTLPLNIVEDANNYAAKPKKISKINALVNETASISTGLSLDALTEQPERTSENYGQPALQKSKIVGMTTIGGYQIDSSYYIKNSGPTACEILALYPEVTVGS